MHFKAQALNICLPGRGRGQGRGGELIWLMLAISPMLLLLPDDNQYLELNLDANQLPIKWLLLFFSTFFFVYIICMQ